MPHRSLVGGKISENWLASATSHTRPARPLSGARRKNVDECSLRSGPRSRLTGRSLPARKERLASEVVELEAHLSDDMIGLKQARSCSILAVRLTQNCHESFIDGSHVSRRQWSLALFAEILVQDRHIVHHIYQEPFRLFLEGVSGRGGSNKDLLVEVSGHYSKRFSALKALLESGAA